MGNELRSNELVSGVVRRLDDGTLVVALGGVEAVVPPDEQVTGESFHVGDPFVGVVLSPEDGGSLSRIAVSRTRPALVQRLLEAEVPEIRQGLVVIRSLVRKPGVASKLTVSSPGSETDSVAVTKGPNGAHLEAVSRLLGGENVDVVAFDDDLVTFVSNVVAPARISRVTVDVVARTATLIVPDGDCKSAVGAKGVNVLLAAQVTGYRVEVIMESKAPENPGHHASYPAS